MSNIYSLLRSLTDKSDCRKLHYAAVIIRNGEVLGTGYNLVVTDYCADGCLRAHIPHGTNPELCCTIHAEEMAILNALEQGFDIIGATMYIYCRSPDGTEMPPSYISCTPCIKSMHYANIGTVIIGSETNNKTYNIDDYIKLVYKKLIGD